MSTAIESFLPHLYGAWRLISTTHVPATSVSLDEAPKIAPQYPMGPSAKGFIFYTPDGHMSASVSANLPPIPSTSPSGSPSTITESQAAAMAKAYLSYSGRFEVELVDEEKGIFMLKHKVEVSLFPNWVGVTQWREARMEKGKDGETIMILRGRDPVEIEGEMVRAVVRWRKS